MLLASTIMMLVLLALLAVVEWRGERRRREVDHRYSVEVEKLASLTNRRYKAKYGKDPTMEVPVMKGKHK